MPLLGSRSGFKNFRDLALFLVGMAIIGYEFAFLPPSKLNPTALVFAGGLVGTPYILGRDESRANSEPTHVVVTPPPPVQPHSHSSTHKRASVKKVAAKKAVKKTTAAKKTVVKKQSKRGR